MVRALGHGISGVILQSDSPWKDAGKAKYSPWFLHQLNGRIGTDLINNRPPFFE